MSKFLQVIEENDPQNTSKMDAAFQAKFFLYENEIPFSSQGTKIILHAEQGDIILEAIAIQPRIADAEEDESINAGVGEYSVGNEVEKLADKASSGLKGMAGKLFGTSAQRAKGAVKERQRVAGQAVDAYRKGTDRLKKGLQAVNRSATNVNY
jgi:uncharacterized protein YjbJ (UPF0337 family)